MLQGVITAGLARNWGILYLADVAFLTVLLAAFAANASCRRALPARWARHREAWAAALRIIVAASPTAWTITRVALATAPPYGASAALNAAVFSLSLLFCSFSATGAVLVRPLPVLSGGEQYSLPARCRPPAAATLPAVLPPCCSG
mgnify:CR=1 FL=1